MYVSSPVLASVPAQELRVLLRLFFFCFFFFLTSGELADELRQAEPGLSQLVCWLPSQPLGCKWTKVPSGHGHIPEPPTLESRTDMQEGVAVGSESFPGV